VTEPTNPQLERDLAGAEIRGLLDGVARRAQERQARLAGAGELVELVLDRLVLQARMAAFAEADRDELEEQLDEHNAELEGTRDACRQLRAELEERARREGLEAAWQKELRQAHDVAVGLLHDARGRVRDLEEGRRRLRETLVSIRNAEIAPGSSAEGLLAAIAILARDVLELDGGLDLAPAAPATAKRDILELGAQLGQAG
jgi:chromosome segregation ATPase